MDQLYLHCTRQLEWSRGFWRLFIIRLARHLSPRLPGRLSGCTIQLQLRNNATCSEFEAQKETWVFAPDGFHAVSIVEDFLARDRCQYQMLVSCFLNAGSDTSRVKWSLMCNVSSRSSLQKLDGLGQPVNKLYYLFISPAIYQSGSIQTSRSAVSSC